MLERRRLIGGHEVISDPATSRRLARFGHEATQPERLVRRLLSERGHRFRIRNRDLPGSPDIANRSQLWAIFVHGCYWHHHVGCARATIPYRNRAFWLGKFRDNRRRDRRVVLELERQGFVVGVLWECEVIQPSVLRARLSKFGRYLAKRGLTISASRKR